MVIYARLVHFNMSKKLSIVSPSPNAEHVNQDYFVKNQEFSTSTVLVFMIVSLLLIIKTH